MLSCFHVKNPKGKLVESTFDNENQWYVIEKIPHLRNTMKGVKTDIATILEKGFVASESVIFED